jgi:hypothetical protein
MVISYNQTLHFRVYCWKIQRQNYNSVHYIFDTIENSHNNMDMEIVAEVCTYQFYWKKLHSNCRKNPCYVEMEWKQQNKICGLSKK